MDHHKKIMTVLRLVPFNSWQYLLLRRHLARCEDCQEHLAGIEEAKAATIPKTDLGPLKDLWPEFVSSLEKEGKKSESLAWPRRRWAVGTAGFLTLAIVLAAILILSPKKQPFDLAVKLRISYVKIYEEPAQAFIFQTQDADRTFVWVEKQNQGETP